MNFGLLSRFVTVASSRARASKSSIIKQNRYMSTIARSHEGSQALTESNSKISNIQEANLDNSKSELRREDVLPLSEEDKKDFFRLDSLFTVEDLVKARVHFGHKENTLNPHMRPYIFGKRLGVLIIDMNHTERMLKNALNVTAETAYRGGVILFFHNSRQSSHFVEDAAKECGEYAYCRRWRDKVFTDSTKLFGTITRLPDLNVFMTTLEMSMITHRAIVMSAKMMIPTIGICDTNSDPTLVTYPVPGNDDTPDSIEFYAKLFKTAVLKGKQKKKEVIEQYGENLYYKTLDCI